MDQFKRNLNGIEFTFQGVLEGKDEICRVSADNHSFKMTTDEEGNWFIREQVPRWLKQMEPELGKAIDDADISLSND
jgi:hypothetical protein